MLIIYKSSRRQIDPYLSQDFRILSKGKQVQIPISDRQNTHRRHTTPSCPVIGNLIGDNQFNCRLNLIQLQRWLTAPSRSRSHMTSHIMAGRSREKICISRHLNFIAFKLTNQAEYFMKTLINFIFNEYRMILF